VGAGVGHGLGDGASDAAGPAGDYRYFAFEHTASLGWLDYRELGMKLTVITRALGVSRKLHGRGKQGGQRKRVAAPLRAIPRSERASPAGAMAMANGSFCETVPVQLHAK